MVAPHLGHKTAARARTQRLEHRADHSLLVNRDSLGEIHAKSVICAPIRLGKQIYGLIHLYSTNPERKLEPDDLEYTLADFDQTHTWKFAVVYELPVGRGRRFGREMPVALDTFASE